jgi:uncharacterized SAM-binding protein YcdF (DUF218 family)
MLGRVCFGLLCSLAAFAAVLGGMGTRIAAWQAHYAPAAAASALCTVQLVLWGMGSSRVCNRAFGIDTFSGACPAALPWQAVVQHSRLQARARSSGTALHESAVCT